MKKIICLASCACLSLFFMGCEDMLNLYPKDSLSPSTYFSNENELKIYTNYFYNQMPGAADSYNESADDFIRTSLGDEMLGQRSPSWESGWTWGMLRRINYYLQHSHNCKEISARNHYDGMAYFMRAYFYLNKVRRYGDVPWYDQVLGSADEELLYKPRDDRKMVMKHVMADLDSAIVKLPTKHSLYEVTKWTALALKSRAGLFEGTFRKYHGLGDYEFFLSEAAVAGKQFITESGYSLYSAGTQPYRDLFACDEAKGEEVIMARCYTGTMAYLHSVQYQANISSDKCCFTRRFANHYLMADGTRFTDKAGNDTIQYIRETKNRDPRMSQTLLCPGYTQKGESKVSANILFTHTGYQFIKYVMETSFDAYNKSPNDWPLFRTAEVYLNFAEAKAELGTLTQNDIDISVNKIKDRAKMPHLSLSEANGNPDAYLLGCYPNVARSTNTGAILEIRRERTIELCLEGHRYWDIMRWKEGKQFENKFYGLYFPGEGNYDMTGDGKVDLILYTTTYKKVLGATAKKIGTDIILSNGTSGYMCGLPFIKISWKENRDYLYPIPLDEIVLTGGILTQNPGWEVESNN